MKAEGEELVIERRQERSHPRAAQSRAAPPPRGRGVKMIRAGDLKLACKKLEPAERPESTSCACAAGTAVGGRIRNCADQKFRIIWCH
jgi:hypothetical protein